MKLYCQDCGAKLCTKPGGIIVTSPIEDAKCRECGGKNIRSGIATDTQVGGDHYRQCKIQPVAFIEANDLGFLEGCAIKRLVRHSRPGGKGRQDIEKAIHELQLLLQFRYGASDERR